LFFVSLSQENVKEKNKEIIKKKLNK